MNTPTLLGMAAGFLTTIAFVPQVMKIWRSKSAKDEVPVKKGGRLAPLNWAPAFAGVTII